MTQVRLQKFLANAGVSSRRKAEELISAGRVVCRIIRLRWGRRVNRGARSKWRRPGDTSRCRFT